VIQPGDIDDGRGFPYKMITLKENVLVDDAPKGKEIENAISQLRADSCSAKKNLGRSEKTDEGGLLSIPQYLSRLSGDRRGPIMHLIDIRKKLARISVTHVCVVERRKGNQRGKMGSS